MCDISFPFELGGLFSFKKQAVDDGTGRLFTPEEGCGYFKVHNADIADGSPAEVGRFMIDLDSLLKCLIISFC